MESQDMDNSSIEATVQRLADSFDRLNETQSEILKWMQQMDSRVSGFEKIFHDQKQEKLVEAKIVEDQKETADNEDILSSDDEETAKQENKDDSKKEIKKEDQPSKQNQTKQLDNSKSIAKATTPAPPKNTQAEQLLKTINQQEKLFKSSIWRTRWLMVMVFVILFNLIAIPFRIAFLSPVEPLFLWCDYISFCFYIADLVFLSKYAGDNSRVVYSDIISSFPYNFLLGMYFNQGLAISQYFLVLQLLKVFRLVQAIYEIEKSARFLNPTRFRLLHLILLSFLIAHWVGCAWFFVGYIEGYGVNDWTPSIKQRSSSIWNQYLRALYWGFINTSGIDNAPPITNLETAFSLLVLFIGVSMYATIVGNVGSLLSNLDSTAAMYREKIDSVTTYMQYKGIPVQLQKRIHDYYDYLWSRQKGLDEDEILSDLPPSLRTEVALFLNREVLQKVPFFKGASENFINVLVRLLKPQVCAPDEYIIKFGDIGREMYFINKGVVVVTSEDGGSIFNVMTDGAFFGEYALLFSSKRSASVKSVTYCDLFVLTQEDFQVVLQDFPEFAQAMMKEGTKRIVEKIPFFKDFSTDFIDTVVGLLKPQTVSAGEYIIHFGEVGNEMYFLCKGAAEVCSGDGKTIFKTLSDGSFFGELSLLFCQKRSASVRAVTHCALFVLTRKDFHAVLKKFPQFAKSMKKTKHQYSYSTATLPTLKASLSFNVKKENEE